MEERSFLPSANEEEKYVTTKEAAEKLGMDSSLLRYYCNQFDSFVSIKKTDRGHRLFTIENIEQLQLIFDLMKDRAMTVKQVSYYLNEYGLSVKKWDIPYPSLKEMENLTDLVVKMREELVNLREETKDFKDQQKETNDKMMSAMIQLAACQEDSSKQISTSLECIQEISSYQRKMLPESEKGLRKFWNIFSGKKRAREHS